MWHAPHVAIKTNTSNFPNATPLLCAESVDLDRIATYLDRSICAMVRGDCHIKAGITGLAKAAHMAEEKGFFLEIHAAATPLLDMGNLYVAAAFTNSHLIEVFPLYFPIFKHNPYAIDRERFPDGPGRPRPRCGARLRSDQQRQEKAGCLRALPARQGKSNG